MFQKYPKVKRKTRAAGHLDNKQMKRTPQKCFRYGSQDRLIAKCTKPPKENEKRQNQVRFNEKGNCTCYNSENNSNQKIYAYMPWMSINDEYPS